MNRQLRLCFDDLYSPGHIWVVWDTGYYCLYSPHWEGLEDPNDEHRFF